MSQHTISSVETVTDERECAFHGCHAEGDNFVHGVPLCLEHFLRDRVRLNLAHLAA
jgi:Zn-finger protein